MKKLTTLTALAVLMSTSAMAQDRTEFTDQRLRGIHQPIHRRPV